MMCESKRPASHAAAARCCERSPKESRSSRLKPRLTAIRSAAVYWSTVSSEPRLRTWCSEAGTHLVGEWCPRHQFHTARHTHVDCTDGNLPGNQLHRLLRGSALRVDRGAARFQRKARMHPGRTHDVSELLTERRHTAADDLVDRVRIHAHPIQHAPLRITQQFRRVDSGQPTLTLAERRSCCVHDDGLHANSSVRNAGFSGNAVPSRPRTVRDHSSIRSKLTHERAVNSVSQSHSAVTASTISSIDST